MKNINDIEEKDQEDFDYTKLQERYRNRNAAVTLLARLLIIFVAIEHLGFMLLEIIFFQYDFGQYILGIESETVELCGAVFINQGTYNGFLFAGLIWAVVCDVRYRHQLGLEVRQFARFVSLFFLGCIVIAGIVGGITISMYIVLIQSTPALMAIMAVIWSYWYLT